MSRETAILTVVITGFLMSFAAAFAGWKMLGGKLQKRPRPEKEFFSPDDAFSPEEF